MQKVIPYVSNILKLAFPIMVGNLGFIMIGVGDVIVAGRHSTDTLAAISIATAIIHCIMMLGIGILSTLSSLLSNYRGAGKFSEKYFYPSIRFAMFLAFLISVIIFAIIPFIDKFGFEANLSRMIKDYFFVTGFSIFGAFLHCVLKEYLQSFEIVIVPNILNIFCIFLNLGLNILFVFGYGIIPEMGVIGLAIASLITRYFMGFVLFFYAVYINKKKYPQALQKSTLSKREVYAFHKGLIKIGFPASIAILIEFVGFNFISIVMGRISAVYAAAHSILCTLSNLSFIIPFSFSIATSVKVGYTNGAKDYGELKNYVRTGLGMCFSVMVLSAVIMGLFPKFLISLFTNDTSLVNVCVPVVTVLCYFQVFDGMQIALSGIFRGLKNTKVVMLSNFIGYWVISIPLGCILGLKYHMNLYGFWWGILTAALITSAIMYTNLIIKLKRLNV